MKDEREEREDGTASAAEPDPGERPGAQDADPVGGAASASEDAAGPPEGDPADEGEDGAPKEDAVENEAPEEGGEEDGAPEEDDEEGEAPEEGGDEDEAPEEGGDEDEAVPGKAKPGKEAVEALLFSSGSALSAKQIASHLGKRVKAARVREWVQALSEDYEATGRAFQVVEISGGYRLMTKPEYFAYVKKLAAQEKSSRLSEAALDTLAVVAYKQPILKADVNQIRGVESGPILKALAEKGLIRAVGRAETLGRPILYGTSRKFLDHFGLQSLKEMPKLDK